MQYEVSKIDTSKARKGVVVFAKNGAKLMENGLDFDTRHQKSLAKALRDSRFQADEGTTFVMPYGGRDKIDTVVVAGLGKGGGKTLADWRLAGAHAAKALDESGVDEAYIIMEESKGGIDAAQAVAAFSEGVELVLYRFERFKTDLKDHQKQKLNVMHFLVEKDAVKLCENALEQTTAQTMGINLTRDLVNLPPNYAGPDYMAEVAEDLKQYGLEVEILGEEKMKELGFGMLLAVGQGSAQESRLLVIKHTGLGKGEPYKAIVGKGVMFDTGGYDLKPADGMQHMKCDMAGAGAVLGTMKALALRGSKANVVGVCGCVLNMVSKDAYLPSDVLTSYKGLTVEIGNTDAEGRLVLGDALAYIIDKEKPTEVVDMATLTGACMIALGVHYAGLFSNNDKLASALEKAGAESGERVWRLPIGPEYSRQLKSEIADVNNIAGGRFGGASTAAAFLEKFVGDTPWAHVDIAGVAMDEKIPTGWPLKGSTGFGVRLLVNYLEN